MIVVSQSKKQEESTSYVQAASNDSNKLKQTQAEQKFLLASEVELLC